MKVAIDLGWILIWEIFVRGSLLVIDIAAKRAVKVIKQVLDCMILIFMQVNTILCTPENHISDVGALCD